MTGLQSGLGDELVLESGADQPSRMLAYVFVVGLLGLLATRGPCERDQPRLPRHHRAESEECTMRLRALKGLIPILAVLGLWQLVGSTTSQSTPSPSSWWTAFKSIESGGSFYGRRSGSRSDFFLEGLVIATIIGIALGIALGSSRVLTKALRPLLEFLRTTPAAAIVPVVILVFHAGDTTDLGVIVYGTIWPILLNVTIGRASMSPLRIEVGHSLGLSWWARMRKIILPSLVPEIVTGIKIAAPICLIVTILVDFLVSTGGLGYQLIQYQESYSAPSAFALLAVIGVLGISISILIGFIEGFLIRRWPSGAGAAEA